ncbi:MAG TPA: ABC transporter ATP-binding protein [Desulfobulbus sp.]|nr:ABC transporter ATP-binding protein [Desulfobulbus sp.]
MNTSTDKHDVAIELRNISFTYPGHDHPVFDSLNFSFRGGHMGLIGDNGSGKTTLFHIMVGLLHPDSGQVLFNGKVMETEEDFTILRRHVGMLFQNADDQLFSPSVVEDIAFGPLNLGHPPGEAREIAMRTLAQVGLEGYEDRITHHLSGGEKRLVALATVLAMEPEILLLDEPTNDLDNAARGRLLEILGSLDQSLILISHDWDFLSRLTSTFYALENGQLVRSNQVTIHQHQHVHPLGDRRHIHPPC